MRSLVVKSVCSIGLFAMASGVFAQSRPADRAPQGLNDRETSGKHLFLQRCSLCHLAGYSKAVDWSEPSRTPAPLGPRLAGFLNGTTPEKEKAVRTFIMSGSGRMPGFQYALEPKQVDDLIAYLKTL